MKSSLNKGSYKNYHKSISKIYLKFMIILLIIFKGSRGLFRFLKSISCIVICKNRVSVNLIFRLC
jgi:hypothetical protein